MNKYNEQDHDKWKLMSEWDRGIQKRCLICRDYPDDCECELEEEEREDE